MTSPDLSLRYCLLVCCSPQHKSQAQFALSFAQAIINSSHHLAKVFFYQSGVMTASSFRQTPQDEIDITAAWQKLHIKHTIELEVCISAALQHGILGPTEAAQYDAPAASLAAGFSIVGLGQLAAATVKCDRIITFGAQSHNVNLSS